MKKNIIVLYTVAILVLSCTNDKKLEEVALPEPEKVTTAVTTDLGNPADVKTDDGPFQMKGLPYAYNALEPHIDAQTMFIHYSKHHLGYANKLNAAIKDTDLATKTIEEILSKLDIKNAALRNNAGGYYNHNLFFEILGPKAGGEPKGVLADAISKDLGSFEALKTALTEAGTKQFGSGWAWLIVDKTGKLVVTQTTNQDNPLMPNAEVKGTPILGIDVWEHAYYLKHQNKRPEYLESIFNVINWDAVSKKYEDAVKK